MPWNKKAGMPKIVRETHEIDATGKVVGRLATHIATLLVGKHRATHVPHIDSGAIVKVSNVDKIEFTGRKWEQKVHYRSSNRPSGITATKMSVLREKNPGEILRHAVKYMLPKNRTQADRLKRLIIVK
ncbi:50S ribosomal protein L13 [Patescibacteria group bacterium]|nr:50S ribosomal protein L13 [Patescibacteria group bacterium]MBU2613479.1 50S ribosomal protein L13 [Patescibacteria group bacterium]